MDDTGLVAGNTKYPTLDGLRGFAALGVLVMHQHALLYGVLQHAYLAVDLFFMISGFVVAHSYEHRLVSGWAWRDFIAVRLIRLYPLYFLGCILGLLYLLGRAPGDPTLTGLTPAQIVVVALSALAFLPSPFAGSGKLWTLNPPSWSLFFELCSNLVYAGLVTHLREKVLRRVVLVAAVLLVIVLLLFGNADGGWRADTFAVGVVRILFAFPCGVLIFRLHQKGAFNAVRKVHWGVLMGALALTWIIPRGPLDSLVDVFSILVLLPIVTVQAVIGHPGRRADRVFEFLGRISYAVYTLHYFVKPLVLSAFAGDYTGKPGAALLVVLLPIPCALLLAWLADRYYDQPVRRLLQAWVAPAARPTNQLGPVPVQLR